MQWQLGSRGARAFLYEEAVPFSVALLTAELFFKFGSFTLETFAFLGLWYGLSVANRWALERLGVAWQIEDHSGE